MTRSLHFILPAFILFLSCFCAYTPAKASHAAGGELIYEWVSDSTYRFYYKFYRDCSGAQAPAAVDMCYRSDCDTNNFYAAYLVKIDYLPGGAPNGTPVNTECPAYLSRCTSASSTVPNYAEWWYTTVITLPYNCNAWHFDATTSARNVIVNIGGGSQSLHVTTMLNSIAAPGNNSPQFSVKPISFVCINQPYTYNNGAVDPDGDSLSFELMQPQDGFDCSSSPISFMPATPAYNLTTNPFQTNNSFALDAATGQMSFTPTLQGANVVTLKASEYRNGQLIGSVMRDVQLNIRPCTNVPPVMAVLPNTIQGAQQSGGQIRACVDKPFSFCFKLVAGTQGTVMVAADNHTVAAPGSVMSYTGQQTDSIYGCFSWTPGPLDTGLVLLTVTAKDSSCGSPGIILSQTFSIPLFISPSTSILRDTTICLSQSVPLFAYGGSQFSWTALPGGSGTASLSCTQCSNPIASPTVTTSYEVTSNLQGGCGKNKDTVTVTVNLQQAPPTPIASSNSAVCIGSTLQLSVNTVSGAIYEWNGPSGFHSQQQNPVINAAQLFHTGLYTVQLSMNGCKSLPATIPVQVKERPEVYTPFTTSYCQGDTVLLVASGSVPGLTYLWTGPLGYSYADSVAVITPATPANSGVYTVVANDNGCLSLPASVNISIFSNQPPVVSSPVTYCQDEQAVPLTATGQNLTWYVTATGGPGTSIAPIPNTSTPGTTTWYVAQYNGGCSSARIPVSVIVKPKPQLPQASVTPGYCEGDIATPLVAIGTAIKWYTQPSGGTAFTTAPVPNTNIAGVQTWYATQTAGGCESDRLPVQVTVFARPAPPATDSLFYCTGSSALPLTAQGQLLLWYNNAAGGNGSATAPVPATGTTGVRTWYVSQTVNGCESHRAPLVVTITPGVAAGLTVSRNRLCTFDTLTITNTAPVDAANNYIWSFDSAIVISGAGNGPYSVRWQTPGDKQVVLQASNRGCSTADTVRVTVLPVPANDFQVQPDACIGQIVHVQAGWDVSRDGLAYTWSFAGADVFSGSGWGAYTLTWATPGVKTISLITDNGLCRSAVFYDTVEVHDFPEAQATNLHPGEICSGDMVTLSAMYKDDYHYQWLPAYYFSGKDSATVTAAITNTGIVRLIVTDAFGCTASDSLFIQTKPCCMISLPDAFTPNGDGRNDVFRIITIGHHQLSTFRILNRWGQTVFETANEQHGWDGTLGGMQQEMGTYFYYLKFKCADGNITEQKGSLMLIR